MALQERAWLCSPVSSVTLACFQRKAIIIAWRFAILGDFEVDELEGQEGFQCVVTGETFGAISTRFDPHVLNSCDAHHWTKALGTRQGWFSVTLHDLWNARQHFVPVSGSRWPGWNDAYLWGPELHCLPVCMNQAFPLEFFGCMLQLATTVQWLCYLTGPRTHKERHGCAKLIAGQALLAAMLLTSAEKWCRLASLISKKHAIRCVVFLLCFVALCSPCWSWTFWFLCLVQETQSNATERQKHLKAVSTCLFVWSSIIRVCPLCEVFNHPMLIGIPIPLWPHSNLFVEGSLELKLPLIWTDGKAEVGRVREEKGRRKKIREEKERRERKKKEDQRRERVRRK